MFSQLAEDDADKLVGRESVLVDAAERKGAMGVGLKEDDDVADADKVGQDVDGSGHDVCSGEVLHQALGLPAEERDVLDVDVEVVDGD